MQVIINEASSERPNLIKFFTNPYSKYEKTILIINGVKIPPKITKVRNANNRRNEKTIVSSLRKILLM